MTSLTALTITGPTAPWRSIGLRVVDGVSWIGGIALHFTDDDAPTALSSWTLTDSPNHAGSIDGIPTGHDVVDAFEGQSWDHPLGVTSFDHVVVMTSSLERTCGAIERITGEPLKRIRELGAVRQGFHRLGPMIVEVVETDSVTAPHASLWGFVVIVDDLHDVAARLGPDVLSPPKAAVQPGRLIASFRSEAGLGLPIALMTPDRR